MAKLGKRLKEIRAASGLTQQSAAERAGIASAHLQVMERGATNPTIAILASLAKTYGVSLEAMFKGF